MRRDSSSLFMTFVVFVSWWAWLQRLTSAFTPSQEPSPSSLLPPSASPTPTLLPSSSEESWLGWWSGLGLTAVVLGVLSWMGHRINQRLKMKRELGQNLVGKLLHEKLGLSRGFIGDYQSEAGQAYLRFIEQLLSAFTWRLDTERHQPLLHFIQEYPDLAAQNPAHFNVVSSWVDQVARVFRREIRLQSSACSGHRFSVDVLNRKADSLIETIKQRPPAGSHNPIRVVLAPEPVVLEPAEQPEQKDAPGLRHRQGLFQEGMSVEARADQRDAQARATGNEFIYESDQRLPEMPARPATAMPVSRVVSHALQPGAVAEAYGERYISREMRGHVVTQEVLAPPANEEGEAKLGKPSLSPRR